jgi:hypothetical protein
VAKPWLGNCVANGATLIAATNVVMNGTAITMDVPYGTRLDDITVYFQISPLATSAPASGTAVDFDLNNDGIPEAIPFVVTAQNGSTQTYTVLPKVGQPSYDDNLLGFVIPNGTTIPVINTLTQTVTGTVAYSATSIAPTWTISTYAKMYSSLPPANPPVVGPFYNICSGAVFQLTGPVTTLEFWIQGEKPTEVSRYVLTVTKDAAATVNTLTSIAVDYTKDNTCGAPYTKTGIVGSIGTSTVTFNLPYGVSSVKVSDFLKTSTLSTTSLVKGEGATVLTNGSTFTVTSESGAVKTYTVVIVNALPSSNKQLLTYGFHKAQNAQWAFLDWTTDYPGSINQTTKLVQDTVAWNTDVHDLIAYFTASDYACVAIANTSANVPQTSDVSSNDHSNSLTYVVTAEDGTQERYQVIVVKRVGLTGNDILTVPGFKITGLPICYSSGTYDVAGTFTGTNIAVSVKSSVNLNSLAYSFSVSPGATVSGPASPANFTNPVTFTVTSDWCCQNLHGNGHSFCSEHGEKTAVLLVCFSR